ncbi:MAG: leucine-rich repeat domain-containing protein [Clostridiales bacterium]|nr:leucine-rich repeat domain-containing protein [Clostridiales bacterium]
MQSVVIPDGVKTISSNTFRDCTSLFSVVLPDSVVQINSGAFENCSNLESILIPDRVTSIAESAFVGTYFYNNERYWTDDMLYLGKHLIKARQDISGSCAIRDYTINIAERAFYNCQNLTKSSCPPALQG